MKKYQVYLTSEFGSSFEVEFETKEEAESYVKAESERYKIYDPWSRFDIEETEPWDYEKGA